MEVRLKLESRYWQKLLVLLKKASYIHDIQIVHTDGDNQEMVYSNNDIEDDYAVLPPEREALLHLSDWDDESIQKIEQAHTSFNQLTAKTW